MGHRWRISGFDNRGCAEVLPWVLFLTATVRLNYDSNTCPATQLGLRKLQRLDLGYASSVTSLQNTRIETRKKGIPRSTV